MKQLRIAVLFGGVSEEHGVSLKSAIEVAAHIDRSKYEPIYIGITRSGDWRLCTHPHADWEAESGPTATISPDRATHGLVVVEPAREPGARTVYLDAVFPVLHGTSGEDGAVQGLLELSGIPYVGCDIQGSVVCMDKSLTYVVARSAGIATPEFTVLDGADDPVPEVRSYPVFVKPARSGSSFGVTKVDTPEELDAAVADARRYDTKVVIEQAVRGTEVGCAVLGDGADTTVGEVDEIRLRHGIFRIHQEAEPEKGSENSVITVPADLPATTRAAIQRAARAIYTALGCRGLARVDMFLQDDGRLLLNEVNTLPGLTAYSRYPRMMAAAGVTMTDLIDRCVALAMER